MAQVLRVALLSLTLCACLAPATPTAGDDGTADDTGSSDVNSLNPLAVGRTWTYDVTSTYASCNSGSRDTRVTAAKMVAERPAFAVENFCGNVGYSNVDGDRVEEYYNVGHEGWMRSLDSPVSDGHTWRTSNGSTTFGLAYEDLGTYSGHPNCWRVTQDVSYTSYWIYCRAVGLVRYETIDPAGGTMLVELSRTNF
ncbi:MAG TPA: hypothetical protein VGM90_13855 [Kofleriaceae bacterium]